MLLLLHTPPAQKIITNKASNILSETIGSEVAIDRIYLSIFEGLMIKGLLVNDPDGQTVIRSGKIAILPKLPGLFSGEFMVGYVGLENTSAKLDETTEGLNIDFIIDAFSSENPDSKEEKSDGFSLSIARVHFENITFQYSSVPGGTEVDLHLNTLDTYQFYFSTLPDIIRLNRMESKGMVLDLLSTKESEPTDTTLLPDLDFGAGFNIGINEIDLKDNKLSYHFAKKMPQSKFSPQHLDLDSTWIHITDILLSEDSLNFTLNNLSTKLSEFRVSRAAGTVQVGKNSAQLSGFDIRTDSSYLNIEASGDFNSWQNLPNELDLAQLNLAAEGNFNLPDFSYFLSDSVLQEIHGWTDIEVKVNGDFSTPFTQVKELAVSTMEAQLMAEGTLNNIDQSDSISWDNLSVDLLLSPKIISLINPMVSSVQLPSKLEVELNSSGRIEEFDLKSQLTSSSGGVDLNGKAGVLDGSIRFDGFQIKASNLSIGNLLNQSSLGKLDGEATLVGSIGDEVNLSLQALIHQVGLFQRKVDSITIVGSYIGDRIEADVAISDPEYRLDVRSDLLLQDQDLSINSNLSFQQFSLGKLFGPDSTLLATAHLESTYGSRQGLTEASINGTRLTFRGVSTDYYIDSLSTKAVLSDSSSRIEIFSDNLRGLLEANFDINQAPQLVEEAVLGIGQFEKPVKGINGNKTLDLNLRLLSGKPLSLISNDIELGSGVTISANYQHQSQTLDISATSGTFSGFGFSFDSLGMQTELAQGKLNGLLQLGNVHYDSVKLGDLDYQVSSKDSIIISQMSMVKDSMVLLGINSKLIPGIESYLIYIDSITSFDVPFEVTREQPIQYAEGNLTFDKFQADGGWTKLMIDGDLNEFELVIEETELQQLNPLLPFDSTLIKKGKLEALFAFVKADNKINLQTKIDSLTLGDSPPLNIRARAVSEGERIPLMFRLESASNNIALDGDYNSRSKQLDAGIDVDINELKVFDLFFKEFLEDISGKVTGDIKIGGLLNSPQYNGQLAFESVRLTTHKPRTTLLLKNEVINLNNAGVTLNNFTIYDQNENPLRLDGRLLTNDYKSFEYDLTVKAEDYWLINNPPKDEYQLQGHLVIGSDINIKGKPNQTRINANLVVKDTTSLTYVMPQQNLELVTGEGVVEFIDPQNPDTLKPSLAYTTYDSIVASLPDFSLVSNLTLEENALLRVVVDANSGDFIEVSGNADLKFEMDRTKNMELNGSYNINHGFYQLSFYDLVKKKFVIKPGSSITWTGNPKNGDLDIVALYSIKTSSLGLISNEIGDSEKGLYSKALPYEVGIIIKGSLESPEISFSLDLPKDEKANYPALSNKLSRFAQPEYEAELNRQVFGLLVLGGFIPESGSGDVNENLIATTALSNSVNAILASQLNRFANQIIKGVDINVGLQSYSDFSTGSGQTRTAMDFRVSKRLMDDRLSIEVGGGMDIDSGESGAYPGGDGFRSDIVVVYDLTESGNKQLKVFNNETYDIVYHEIRNTGVSLIFIREFDKGQKE